MTIKQPLAMKQLIANTGVRVRSQMNGLQVLRGNYLGWHYVLSSRLCTKCCEMSISGFAVFCAAERTEA